MTCHSVNPNNPYEIYELPHISPRFRTKCYYLHVVLNKQRILHKNQLVTISRKKERERSSFLALGLLSILCLWWYTFSLVSLRLVRFLIFDFVFLTDDGHLLSESGLSLVRVSIGNVVCTWCCLNKYRVIIKYTPISI